LKHDIKSGSFQAKPRVDSSLSAKYPKVYSKKAKGKKSMVEIETQTDIIDFGPPDNSKKIEELVD